VRNRRVYAPGEGSSREKGRDGAKWGGGMEEEEERERERERERGAME
jgi:hypothetical protein